MTVLGAAGLLLAIGAPAGADGGSTSPPAGSVATSCSNSSTENVNPGSGQPSQVTMSSTCAFAANSPVSVSFNGTVVANVTADSSGTVTLTFDAKDPSIAVDSGTYHAAAWGVNTFVASGTNASGAANTADFLIDVEHFVTAAAAVTPPSSAPGGLAFTGADLAALIAAGLALILLGGAIVLYTRRRAEEYRSPR